MNVNYETRYKEALDKARLRYQGKYKPEIAAILAETLQSIFPELKESEDERIRKEIIAFLLLPHPQLVGKRNHEEWIAWLEKQDEQNMIPLDKVINFLDEQLVDDKDEVTGEPFINFQNYGAFKETFISFFKRKMLERQSEQKPVDKVESKFHEREWLAENHPNNYARFVQILEIVNVQGKNRYRISRDLHNDEDIVECRFIEDNWHPFNIQDAKDGDVLVASDRSIFIFAGVVDRACKYYAALTVCDNVIINKKVGNGLWENSRAVRPSTKEERDLLFAKMEERGYKWDADKKELVSIVV